MQLGALLLLLIVLGLCSSGLGDVVFTAEPCDRDVFGLRGVPGDTRRYKQCGPSGNVWIVPCAPQMSFDPVEKVCKETEEGSSGYRRMEKFQGRSRRPIITTPTTPTPEEFVFSTHRPPKRPRIKGKGKKKTTTPLPITTSIFPAEPVYPEQPPPAFPPPGSQGATTIRPEYTVKYNGENMTEEELLRRLVDIVKAQKETANREKTEKEEQSRLEMERQRMEEEKRKKLEEEEKIRAETARKEALAKEERRKKLEVAQRKKAEERRLALERAEAARRKLEEEDKRRLAEEEEKKRKIEEEIRIRAEEEEQKRKEEEERRRKEALEEELRIALERAEKERREEEARIRKEQERLASEMRAAGERAEKERLEQARRIEEARREQQKMKKEEEERKEKEELMRRERERAERIKEEMKRQLEMERLEMERQIMFKKMATTTPPDFEIIRFPPKVIPPLPETTTITWITADNSWKPPVDIYSEKKQTITPQVMNGCIPNGDCPFSYDGDSFCAHPDNPALYLQCAPMIGRRGRWTIRNCPEGLLFSNHLGRCEKDPYSAYNPNQRVVIPRLPEETRQVNWQGNREIVTVAPMYPQSKIHNTIDSFPRDLLPVMQPIQPGDLFKPKQPINEFDDYEELDLSKIHPLFPRVQPSFFNNFLPFQPLQEGEKKEEEDNIIGAVFKPFLKKVALKQTKHFLDRMLSDEELRKVLEDEKDRLRGEGTSQK